MKIILNIAIMILVSFAAIGTQAQTGAQKVVATIPFDFSVGKTILPAGKYTVTVTNPTSDRKILHFRKTGGRASAMVMTTDVACNISDDAKLVFHRYGDRYFFAQAQMAGDSTSLAAVKSRNEQKQAIATTTKEIVVLAAG